MATSEYGRLLGLAGDLRFDFVETQPETADNGGMDRSDPLTPAVSARSDPPIAPRSASGQADLGVPRLMTAC